MHFLSTNIAPGSLVDLYQFPPMPTSGFQSYTDPLGDIWVAKAGTYNTWLRPTDVLKTRVWRNAPFNITTANLALALDIVSRDVFSLYSGTNWTCPLDGMYRIIAQVAGSPTLSGQSFIVRVYQNGGLRITSQHDSSASGAGWSLSVIAVDEVFLAATDLIQVNINSSSTSGTITGLPGNWWTYLNIAYAGSG